MNSPYTSLIKYSPVQSSMSPDYVLNMSPRSSNGESLRYPVDQGFHGKYDGPKIGEDYIVF
ncbi:hypothetical protein GOV13_00405 [Candidatus Pacearchaeota archaeon]|nr:hypothetical protein [Candidatus Pacearchaeota archaeon]